MESQRIRSLTTGYLKGWLNFEYPQHLSYLREQLIIKHIEEEQVNDLLRFRAIKDIIVAAGQIASSKYDNNRVLDFVKNTFKSILHMTLPWLKEQKEDKINIDELKEVKEAFRKRREAQEQKNA